MTMLSRERSFNGLAAIRGAVEVADAKFADGGEPRVWLHDQALDMGGDADVHRLLAGSCTTRADVV